MGTSLARGVASLDPDIEAVLVVLGDMPRVPVSVYRALTQAFDGAAERILVPTFEGGDGHPVLFGGAYFAALKQLEGDEGARRIRASNAAAVRRVEVGTPGILLDVDTPEGLRALK